MKKNGWLILSAMLSTSLFAQQTTNPPPVAPAPKAPAKPAAKPAAKKKAAAAKPAPKKSSPADELRSIPLVAGSATVIASNVNVRGRSGLIGEVIAQSEFEAIPALDSSDLLDVPCDVRCYSTGGAWDARTGIRMQA